jgi:pyruvate dehydrogenase E1 component alpha subunit
VWKLPVVFLVENNQYGMGTEVGRASARSDIFEKGCAYGIESAPVDGQDVLAVYKAVLEALEHARTDGPYLMEAKTYRYAGHSMGDPERYRSKSEIEEWRSAHDPIKLLGQALMDRSLADEAVLDKITKQVEPEIEEIVHFAQESPEPEDAALYENVYVNPAPRQ